MIKEELEEKILELHDLHNSISSSIKRNIHRLTTIEDELTNLVAEYNRKYDYSFRKLKVEQAGKVVQGRVNLIKSMYCKKTNGQSKTSETVVGDRKMEKK
jgi:hypothetical protein